MFASLFPYAIFARCDLLEKKLLSGVKVKDYVPSFGDRKNDVHHVTQCKNTNLYLLVVVLQY